jgi:hypothetical protein
MSDCKKNKLAVMRISLKKRWKEKNKKKSGKKQKRLF